MDNIYLILVFILFMLAISDLVVGVANDAVNFLNSAVGSKAASYRTILFIASIGIFLGATFSTGMMEVARNGIFNPQYFYFKEIMIIFIAVMITDVILLDAFNSLGLPTSTTVSLVSELMGAAVAVSIYKIATSNPHIIDNGIERLATIGDYINTAKSLGIITGILSSVVIAFTTGVIIQFIIRTIFTFNYEPKLKYMGSLLGGVAITTITYFLLIKGAKDAVFMSPEAKAWIKENSGLIIAYSIIAWTILLQILTWLFRINILKMVVLTGTFALAMAFAGNDLVNFIGVPIAGFSSYEIFSATPNADATTLLMTGMAADKSVTVPSYMLFIAGAVMVLTLWFSKKAKNVTKTELSLSRQNEGEERFGSSFLARNLVRSVLRLTNTAERVLPKRVYAFLASRFDGTEAEAKRKAQGHEAPHFDMLRATVNLVTSSMLIALATSHKLPLSTTYVTFMVAMGSSLADRSWGRESAVYRITGVLSVIGGWFFTAFSAFTGAFVFAMLINWLGWSAVIGLLALAIYFVYHTHVLNKRKQAREATVDSFEIEEVNGEILPEKIFDRCKVNVIDVLKGVSDLYHRSLTSFEDEDRRALKQITKEVAELNANTKQMRHNIYPTVRKLQEGSIDSGLFYVQVIDYLRESAHCLTYISTPCFEHLDNNHKVFMPEQFEDLNELKANISDFFEQTMAMIGQNNFKELDNLQHLQGQLMEHMRLLRKKQLKRIKKEKAGTRMSLLYLNILHETQNMLLHVGNLLKAQRDFVKFQS
ncbi:phosphate/sulfate permease [Breznakibacter xylanolyticus]|uniref:Phosphate transporter n=2 Tax=Breznakibacter xylanolyticus TaxID=990 RepID=A0A2W7NJP7_9BACT|nr:phosphate/sulfate permease [Breznakibacter xylanolyticus]